MADVLDGMLQGALEALDRGDRKRIGETRRMDDVLDRLNGAITAYLTRLHTEDLDEQDDRRLSAILAVAAALAQRATAIAATRDDRDRAAYVALSSAVCRLPSAAVCPNARSPALGRSD